MPIYIRKIIYSLILIVVTLVGCESRSGIEEGLTYDEYIQKAHQSINEGAPDMAIAAYKKALLIKPQDANTHYELGLLYYEEWQESLQTSRRKASYDLLMNPGGKHDKDIVKEHEKYGLKSEYLDIAIDEFKETVKYDAGHWEARYRIASNYFNNKQYEKAVKEAKEVIKLNPSNGNSYSLIGEAYIELGLFDSAIEYLKIAAQRDPNSEYDYYYLAIAYRKNNNGWMRRISTTAGAQGHKISRHMACLKTQNLSLSGLTGQSRTY